MFHQKTITLNDTELRILRFILNNYTAQNEINLYHLIKDPLSCDEFILAYQKQYELKEYLPSTGNLKYQVRPESLAHYLIQRLEEEQDKYDKVIGETYTIDQLQKILKLSDRTIFRLLKSGQLTGFKIGREWRFQESDINDYIQAQRDEAKTV